MTPPWSPVLVPLAAWLDRHPTQTDPAQSCRLQVRDTRLTEARILLCCAADLIEDTVLRHRPAASGPAAAVELDLLAERLAGVDEDYDGSADNPVLLRRAAVLCAGEEWSRLVGLLAPLRLRVSAVTEAIADTAVALNRLERGAVPGLSLVPSPELASFAEEEAAIADELRRRTAKAGAESAYAAADGAVLPSLTHFLR
jgi:hypothetical protein